MTPTKLIILTACGALLLNSAAFAQPDHAPAHGARDKGNSSQHQTQQHDAHHTESAQNERRGGCCLDRSSHPRCGGCSGRCFALTSMMGSRHDSKITSRRLMVEALSSIAF